MNCPNCQNPLRDQARFCTACGIGIATDAPTVFDPSSSLRTQYDAASEATVVRPGRMIGRLLDAKYQLTAQLGEGGMGTVYRARRVHIGDEVAVKILHSKYVAEEDGIERFRREARAAAMLHHPNVVTIHDYGESGGDAAPAYIVMELISGLSLREVLKRQGRLSVDYAITLMSHICAGVAAAHRQNIIHRDLKPDNILIPSAAEEGHVAAKVVDFGIAKLRDLSATQALTMTGGMIGTPYYMSPEQCRGETLDGRADVYSLGAMMYEMLVGVRPFASPTPTAVVAKHLAETPPPFPAPLGIPATIEAVIMRALAKDAASRQTDAAVLARELRDALQPSAVVAAGLEKAPVERLAERIEVPLRSPHHFQEPELYSKTYERMPERALHERMPERALKTSHLVVIAMLLLLFGAAGTAAFLFLRANQTAPPQDTTVNHNVSPSNNNSNPTTTSTNANQPPLVITTTRDLPVRNANQNKPANNESVMASTVDVSGNWQSFYGSVRLSQAGSAISGSIVYADGSGTGRISGTLNGRKLTFTWKDANSTYNGAGTVALSADGHLLKGNIRLNGTTQPLELRR
ncbi:MAG: protein kinase [Acidobacteria bacterium]|nr:protein kinase [Acidobacteriota bacterium]